MQTIYTYTEALFLAVGAGVCIATALQLLIYSSQMCVERWSRYSVLGRNWRDYVKHRESYHKWRKMQGSK